MLCRWLLPTRNPDEGLIHHSDRGSQYASCDYQNILQQKGIVGSMSRRGNCYDNAPTESWFATLKRELVYRTYYTTHAQARQDIFRVHRGMVESPKKTLHYRIYESSSLRKTMEEINR